MDIQAKLSGDVRTALLVAVERRAQLVDLAVQKAGLECEATAKQNAPVDTGFLKSSIHYEKTGPASCTVEVGASYGIFVEMGHLTGNQTSRVPPRPFLFPAYITATRTLMQVLKVIAKA